MCRNRYWRLTNRTLRITVSSSPYNSIYSRRCVQLIFFFKYENYRRDWFLKPQNNPTCVSQRVRANSTMQISTTYLVSTFTIPSQSPIRNEMSCAVRRGSLARATVLMATSILRSQSVGRQCSNCDNAWIYIKALTIQFHDKTNNNHRLAVQSYTEYSE